MYNLPGKLVVLNPEVAARAVEQHPELADKVFTIVGLDPATGYVINVQAIEEELSKGLPDMRFDT